MTFLKNSLENFQKIYLFSCPSDQTRKDLIKLNIFPENKLKILYDPILQIKKIKKI